MIDQTTRSERRFAVGGRVRDTRDDRAASVTAVGHHGYGVQVHYDGDAPGDLYSWPVRYFTGGQR